MKLITAKTKADKMGPMEKPAELESVEAKVEVRPAVKIVPTATEETKPVETKPIEVRPLESKAMEAKSDETLPVPTKTTKTN